MNAASFLTMMPSSHCPDTYQPNSTTYDMIHTARTRLVHSMHEAIMHQDKTVF